MDSPQWHFVQRPAGRQHHSLHDPCVSGEKPQQPGEHLPDESPEAVGHANSHQVGSFSQDAAAPGSEDPVTPVRQPPDVSGGPDFEAVVLSEVWQVFEQLVKEVKIGKNLCSRRTCAEKGSSLGPVSTSGIYMTEWSADSSQSCLMAMLNLLVHTGCLF